MYAHDSVLKMEKFTTEVQKQNLRDLYLEILWIYLYLAKN